MKRILLKKIIKKVNIL